MALIEDHISMFSDVGAGYIGISSTYSGSVISLA